ncbi:aminotransferase class I/II-fold pyridoxal phosphate-dependent enzyme [Phreatobacter sp.]|uniref:aminotransferase class I/II-fold pyridoxal phosphate-dependent enzyme n=1 Tax=Phreatobacter sp. TaxID=1966341 RepID=UPI003F70E851
MIDNSLSVYAARRLAFEAGSTFRGNSPYNISLDDLRAEAARNGAEFLSFGHYDYIGIAEDVYVADRAIQAIRDHGCGVGASRLVGGERNFHRELESRLARFLGTDDVLAMVSGYGTNSSLIGHMMGASDLIVYDSLSHNSIIAGLGVTRAETVAFEHNNLDALDALLAERRDQFKRVLIVCEGLYSMDGDFVDLPRIVALKERYDAWLYVDEAHSIGVMGRTGRGVAEHFGIDRGQIDITMGTLSKTFGSCGGFVAATQPVIDWLRHTLPGYVYSVGLSPSTTIAALAALEVLETEPERVAVLQHNSRYFVEGARRRGLRTGLAGGFAIVPIHFSTKDKAVGASRMLRDNGIYCPPIVKLAVPKDLPRLRMFISAAHSEAQIDRTLDLLHAFARERGDLVMPASPVPAHAMAPSSHPARPAAAVAAKT